MVPHRCCHRGREEAIEGAHEPEEQEGREPESAEDLKPERGATVVFLGDYDCWFELTGFGTHSDSPARFTFWAPVCEPMESSSRPSPSKGSVSGAMPVAPVPTLTGSWALTSA